ncbi:MAG: RNA methyltransferase, partial [Verrucomicrobiota bacterium]
VRTMSLGPVIVLDRPSLPENIGMVARAMLNCGLQQLRVVGPPKGWLDSRARATASGADLVLDGAQAFATAEEALADRSFVLATTARTRSLTLPVYHPEEAMAQVIERGAADGTAILFGTENSGLDNDVLSRCNAVLNFPTNSDFSSLNLAQAVLLLGWEWRKTQLGDNGGAVSEPSASQGELVNFMDRLERELDARGFFLTKDLRTNTLRNLRTIFAKSNPTDAELKMLHGVVSALIKR